MMIWVYVALAVVADGVVGLAGGLFSDGWLKRHQAALVGFAAGAMIAAAFLDALPEAWAAFGTQASAWAFGGSFVMAIVEWGLGHHHHHAGAAMRPSVAISLLASDALHNLGDGAAIAAAFLISPRAGLSVALAVIAHEVPQEMGDFAILRAAGYPRRRALLALAAVQLSAALGALLVALAFGSLGQVTAATLALAAGAFLYIGATDLLPELHSGQTAPARWERMAGFLCGVGLMVLIAAA